MGRLGDQFPESSRREYADREVAPGHVVYLFCDFTRPPKEKYLVVVAVHPRPLLFVINSRVPDFVASRPHLASCQVPIRASDHPFLAHDSFINCAEVIDCIDFEAVMAQVVADTRRIKGALTAATIQCVVTAVQGAKTISPKHKAEIVAALG